MSNVCRDHQRTTPHRSDALGTRGMLALATLVGLAVLAQTAFAAGPVTPQKMLRQIGVMEKIIDKVLVDSPNVLVSGMGNTRGLYVEPFGVVFTFTASILRGDSPLAPLSEAWSFSTQDDLYDITTDKDGNQVITIKKGKKQEKDKDAQADAESDKEGEKGWQTERVKKYESAKAELVQTMLDYGETITSLKAGQTLLIAGFIKDDDFFKEEKISRFVLQAKVDDLRAFASGELTESVMRSRIQTEEY
jgi:hypothetical protein